MHEGHLLISNLPQLVTKDDLMFQDFIEEGEHLENHILEQDLDDRLLEERISDTNSNSNGNGKRSWTIPSFVIA